MSTLTKLINQSFARNNPTDVLYELQKTHWDRESEIEQRFLGMDSDGDGTLSLDEFVGTSLEGDISDNTHPSGESVGSIVVKCGKSLWEAGLARGTR